MKSTVFQKIIFGILFISVLHLPAFSSVIYTDVIPDLVTIPSSTAMFDVDLDNNSSPDVRITCVDITGLKFIIAQAGQIGLGNFLLIDTSGGVFHALALASNTSIGPSNTVWHSMASSNPTLLSDFFGTFSGLWLGSQDYYLGVKFLIGANTHYGWIRMNITQSTSVVTLKDYAYESQPNVPILAGVPAGADVATNITLTDIDENNNALDFEVSFTKAANENTVESYEIIVVKDGVTNFNLAFAQSLSSASKFSYLPNGSNVQTILSGSLLDSDGDALKAGDFYKVFILSKADTNVIPFDGLSQASNSAQLNTRADISPSITCTDVSNNANGTDLHVSFTKAVKENRVGNYRLIMLKSADAATYTLNDAQNISAGRFTDVAPTGGNYILNLSSVMQDKDGDAIQENIAYKAVILSIADGLNANVDSLSEPSNEITLTQIPTGIKKSEYVLKDFYASGRSIEIILNNFPNQAYFALYDISGRQLFHKKINELLTVIYLSDYQGAYIGTLNVDDSILSKRLILK